MTRHAVVTGASSGIGAATARLLAHEGYRVVLLARRIEALDTLRTELERSAPRGHLAIACDLREPAQIDDAFARITRELRVIDLLVNNAGLGYRARVEELDPRLLRDLFATNVEAPLLCARAALPALRASERAVVINVASVVGRRGIPGQAAYAASKAALISIGESLRLEWAHEHIAVCTLNPALTATGFFEAQPNPSGLAAPDLSRSQAPIDVARHVLALDRAPRPEVSLRSKWHWLAALTLVSPRLADRVLLRRLGWTPPER